MTFLAACAWSLVRSLLVAGLGLVVSHSLNRTLQRTAGRAQGLLAGLVLLPLFIPGLLIGYGYRNFSLSLVHHPLWNELTYAGLLLFLVVPVGTLILWCAPPPPVSNSARHVARLMGSGRSSLRGLSFRAMGYRLLPAGAVMFLLAFQETEIATLMQARGWPEWIFTRLAIDLSLTDAVGRLLLPVVPQAVVLGAAVWVVVSSGQVPSNAIDRATRGDLAVASWLYAGMASTALLIVPASLVLRGTLDGFAVLAAHPALMSQIGIAFLFGVTAGGLAWVGSGGIIERISQPGGWLLAGLALLPGLLGAWTLGLTIAALLSLPGLHLLAGTPVPMLIAEVLFQLPRATLLRLLLRHWQRSAAAHSARLLQASPAVKPRAGASAILWRLETRGRVSGAMIVCYWSYMELTIPSPALLGPPGMTTAPVLLYNQMHYGQIPGLSALVSAVIAAPIVVLIGLGLLTRLLLQRHRPV